MTCKNNVHNVLIYKINWHRHLTFGDLFFNIRVSFEVDEQKTLVLVSTTILTFWNWFYALIFFTKFHLKNSSLQLYKHFLCERIHKPIFIFTFGRADSLSVRCICFFFNYIWCVAIFFKLFLLLIIVKVNF